MNTFKITEKKDKYGGKSIDVIIDNITIVIDCDSFENMTHTEWKLFIESIGKKGYNNITPCRGLCFEKDSDMFKIVSTYGNVNACLMIQYKINENLKVLINFINEFYNSIKSYIKSNKFDEENSLKTRDDFPYCVLDKSTLIIYYGINKNDKISADLVKETMISKTFGKNEYYELVRYFSYNIKNIKEYMEKEEIIAEINTTSSIPLLINNVLSTKLSKEGDFIILHIFGFNSGNTVLCEYNDKNLQKIQNIYKEILKILDPIKEKWFNNQIVETKVETKTESKS